MKPCLQLIVISLLLVLAACKSAPKAGHAAMPLEGTTWTLTELRGSSLSVPPGEMKDVTLLLEKATRRASGSGGVNRYRGTYELEGGELEFSSFLSTRMAGPPAAMSAEQAYLAALGEVTAWRMVEGHLELLAGDRVVVRFEPVVPDPPAPPKEEGAD